MMIFGSLDAVAPDFGPSAVTIGKFDGVHSGHRRIIAELREIAAEQSLLTAVVTFDRHPLMLLKPEIAPAPLVSLEQKVELIGSLGVDATLVLTFDEQLSERSPEDFVRSILVDTLHAKVLLVGSDFRFGARGAGDITLLRSMGEQLGFTVRVIDDVRATDGRRASSTWIRELLAEGRVAEAGELLGYPPCVRAIVVHGEKRGRELGYPTANVPTDGMTAAPADGVYAGWLRRLDTGETYPAAISVGTNPTFDGVRERRVESYVLDRTDLELYGLEIEVSFVDRLRGMVAFESVDALLVRARGLRALQATAQAAIASGEESLTLNPRGGRHRRVLQRDVELFGRLSILVTRVLGMIRAVRDNYDDTLADEPTVRDIATELRRAAHDLRLIGRDPEGSEPATVTAELPALTAPLAILKPHPTHWILIGSLLEDLRRVREEIMGTGADR